VALGLVWFVVLPLKVLEMNCEDPNEFDLPFLPDFALCLLPIVVEFCVQLR
jgi:hypothetical protein